MSIKVLPALLCLIIQACSSSGKQIRCGEFETGVYQVQIDGVSSILAVYKSKFEFVDHGLIEDEFEFAEISAKALLSKQLQQNTLVGAHKLYECVIDDDVYVGIYTNKRNESRAKKLNELLMKK